MAEGLSMSTAKKASLILVMKPSSRSVEVKVVLV